MENRDINDTLSDQQRIYLIGKILSSKGLSGVLEAVDAIKDGLDVEIPGLERKLSEGEKINQINYVIKFLQEIENNQELAILKENKLWTSVFNEKNKIEFGLDIMMITYKDILNKKFGLPLDFMIDYQSVVEQLSNQNSVLQLCKKIEIILEMKRRLKVNINNNLLIDQLILLFKEV